MIWFNNPHDLKAFTPAWAFLIFPMMLVGVVAFNVLKVIPPEEPRAVGVLLVGYAFQGLGFFMTFFYICIYVIRRVSSVRLAFLLLTFDPQDHDYRFHGWPSSERRVCRSWTPWVHRVGSNQAWRSREEDVSPPHTSRMKPRCELAFFALAYLNTILSPPRQVRYGTRPASCLGSCCSVLPRFSSSSVYFRTGSKYISTSPRSLDVCAHLVFRTVLLN